MLGVALPRGPIMDVVWKIHKALWQLSGGRLGSRSGGMPVLELTTTGRKSGELRSVLLHYIPHDNGYLVLGSNVGRDRPPAWSLNLQAEPRATVKTAAGKQTVRARRVDGAERERLWDEAVASKADYAEYAGRTDRPIPVFVLERTG